MLILMLQEPISGFISPFNPPAAAYLYYRDRIKRLVKIVHWFRVYFPNISRT